MNKKHNHSTELQIYTKIHISMRKISFEGISKDIHKINHSCHGYLNVNIINYITTADMLYGVCCHKLI